MHNISSGLNLDVLDQYTGKSRSVETLSGGETFLASLALALGLSDTVQQQSGGIQLNAMFIDEGFGSLDSTALDNAVQVLQQLSDHQRTIGIISHVSELAERFEAQLQVKKKRKRQPRDLPLRIAIHTETPFAEEFSSSAKGVLLFLHNFSLEMFRKIVYGIFVSLKCRLDNFRQLWYTILS